MLTAILALLGTVFAVVILAIAIIVLIYNGLVTKRSLVNEGWSGIEVQLRRRFNLVENLVTTVKGYASHETELLEKITNLRASVRSDDPSVRGQAEAQVSGALANIFAVAEGYPDLKADQYYLQLQTELSDIEDHIQQSRRYYNGAVRDFNIACETFPSVLIAQSMGFQPASFFELESDEERALPKVDFS